MFPILIDAVVGALAGALGFLLVRRIAPLKRNPRLQQIISVIVVVGGFQLASQLVSPRVLEWKYGRDFDRFLATDPTFRTILADQPTLRGPLRAAALKAYRSGRREDAMALGNALLSPIFPQYLSRASDASTLKFTAVLIHTLRALEARDPEACYSYLYPRDGRVVPLSKNDGRDEVMAAMRDVVLSAHRNPTAVDEDAANVHLQKVITALRKNHGDEVVRASEAA